MTSPHLFSQDGYRITFRESDDGMKVFMSLKLEPGPRRGSLSPFMIENLLEQAGYRCTVHREALEEIVGSIEEKREITERRIGKGVSPKAGEDGRVVMLVRAFHSSSLPNFTLHPLDNVKLYQPVIRVMHATPGSSGRTVRGVEVPPHSGVEPDISWDQTLKPHHSSTGHFTDLIAQQIGCLVQTNNTFSIQQQLTLPEVSPKTGSPEFVGSVQIDGDISSGLTVRGDEGIIVKGDVRNSNLISLKGNIEVKGTLVGGKQSAVRTEKNFVGTVLRSAKIFAGQQLVIQREAINCFLQAGGIIEAPSALITGGRLEVGIGVEVFRIGSELEVVTEVKFGGEIIRSAAEMQLSALLDSHEEAEKMLVLHLGRVAEDPLLLLKFPPPARKKLEALYEKLQTLRESKQLLQRKLKNAQTGTRRIESWLVIHEVAFPGVSVIAEGNVFSITTPLYGPKTLTYSSTHRTFILVEGDARSNELNTLSRKES